MQLIRIPGDVTQLPISSIQHQALLQALTECTHGSLTLTCDLWSETETSLLYLIDGDEASLKPALTTQLQFLICNPEYVIRIDDTLFLALAILSDSGQGLYLLFSPTATFKGADALISIAENVGV
ncbi:hypothetical protein ACUH7A_003908 [Yersinia enterocolitica]|nr:hypothetical protein [Yersinia enterocolitica]